MLFSKVQHDPPKSESPSRPLSAPNTGRPTSASPRRARPTSAGSSAFPTTDGSFSSKIISGKPSCIPLIRARNPIIRTPKVTLYRNGQALDGTGKPFTLSQNMPQILGEITAALQLPFSAKYLFNDKGMPLDKVDLFNDNMDVIVSMGERFKYRTYMDRDEYDSLNRTCKYCNESYTPADNTADSCCHHPLRFLASRWLCCKARERSAPGCHRGFHCDPKIEDDKNVLPTRRCVNAVLNGMPISGPHVVVVDIPSKLEIVSHDRNFIVLVEFLSFFLSFETATILSVQVFMPYEPEPLVPPFTGWPKPRYYVPATLFIFVWEIFPTAIKICA
eukprot:TRINITY_DN1179_c0_g1_i2.p1 TRINITY_DN1179_c0_g1~~TRINITY_DN1179_c0_g1_i2.p1  ORF type:complete len:332 (+),score=36.33 TRINITY_DN1179_c0_g1_i2:178-1173(+)